MKRSTDGRGGSAQLKLLLPPLHSEVTDVGNNLGKADVAVLCDTTHMFTRQMALHLQTHSEALKCHVYLRIGKRFKQWTTAIPQISGIDTKKIICRFASPHRYVLGCPLGHLKCHCHQYRRPSVYPQHLWYLQKSCLQALILRFAQPKSLLASFC